MTNNKQYPYSFKHDIANAIAADKKADNALKKHTSKHHTSYIYNDLKLSQHISNFLRLFQWSVAKICDQKIIKNLIWKERSTSIQDKCNNIRRWYYSSAKRAIQNLEVDEEKLNERMLLVWYNMMGKHLNISNWQTDKPEETKKRILKLSTWDKSLLIESCISGDLKSLPFILNVLYPDNEDERYIIIERVLSYLDENSYKNIDNSCFIESIFNTFNLRDWNRNFQLLKELIIHRDWKIECKDIPKFWLQNDQDKLEISKLLLSYNVHYELIPSFELLDIQSEDIRFEIAKLVAQKESYIWEYLEKFNITDHLKLQELAQINSQIITTKDGDAKPINQNFINHALKFMIPEDKMEEYIDRTLTYDTIFEISDSWLSRTEILLPILEKILSISSEHYSLEKNLWYLFSYLNQLQDEESALYYSEIWKYLTAQRNTNNTIKILKILLEEWKITNKQYSEIFENYYCKDLSKKTLNNYSVNDYIYTLTYTWYWDIQPSPFSTRTDIISFIKSLEKGWHINNQVKEAILIENHHFEQLKNFVILLFKKGADENLSLINIDNSLNSKQLSRQLFFDRIGIKFPQNKEKYNKEKIQEFYIITYRLYESIWWDFLKNLQLDESVFQKNILPQLTTLFTTILNIISTKNTNKYNSVDNNITDSITEYNFSQLDDDIAEDMLEIFNRCNTIGDISIHSDNINYIVSDFSNILIYLFQKQFHIEGDTITSEDFNNLNEKWWNIDVIYTLFSQFKWYENAHMQKILSRITEMIALDKFNEYKYVGYPGDIYDKELVNDQIWFLDEDQTNIWKENKIVLHYYSWKKNANQDVNVFVEMNKIIQNGFIDNQHLDEISWWYTDKIIQYSLTLDEQQCFDAIINKLKVDEIISNFPQLDSDNLFDLWFVSLLKANNEKEIIASINFIKRISIKYWFDISKLKTEFDLIFSKKKILHKNNSESIFFTCETDNPKILLEIWDLVKWSYSCQNYKWWSWYLKALPGYVVDAWVKALLSFEISRQNFKDNSSWILFKESIQKWDYSLKFNEYKLCLEINEHVIQFTTAWYRNIMKLWKEHNNPVLFLEQAYTNLSHDKQSFISSIHSQLKEDKLDNMKGDLYPKNGIFPESRNPWGIYVDANNTIETLPHSIKLN